jgi:hypothetical protein
MFETRKRFWGQPKQAWYACEACVFVSSNGSADPSPGQVSEAQLSRQQQEALIAEIGRFEAWLDACADAPPAGYITLAKPGADAARTLSFKT